MPRVRALGRLQDRRGGAVSFVKPQSNSHWRSAGLAVAVLFHVALVWALANGLGQQLAKVVSEPLETVLVEEVKPPPPPPKVIELPPPPKFTPPPPAYVPPPEVQVQAPPTHEPTIAAVAAESPPPAEPVRSAPPAPAAAPPAPPPAAPAPPVSASVVCANYAQVMGDAGFPREATRLGLEEGSAVIQFTLVASGDIRDIKAVSASHPIFAKASMRIVGEYKCKGAGRDVTVQVPFSYRSS